jgi:hypothetical protein
VRNVIVHNSGLANAKLVGDCPWLGLTLGERIEISSSKFSVYITAIALYANLIFVRSMPFFGVEPGDYAPLVKVFEERFAAAAEAYESGR